MINKSIKVVIIIATIMSIIILCLYNYDWFLPKSDIRTTVYKHCEGYVIDGFFMFDTVYKNEDGNLFLDEDGNVFVAGKKVAEVVKNNFHELIIETPTGERGEYICK
jgi:hypothetical protein